MVIETAAALKQRFQKLPSTCHSVDSRPLSLLMNLQHHGRLADANKAYLDAIAPSGTLCFLIHGQNYLHPEETPLFPIEIIESSLAECGSPIFSHRYSPNNGLPVEPHRITSTVAGKIEGVPLILGLFGRESIMASAVTEITFSDAVAAFRRAVVSMPDLREKILPEIARTEACCVLDRNSGLVLAANQAFAQRAKLDLEQVIDTRFDDMANDQLLHFADNKLSIQNVDIGEFSLAIVISGDSSVHHSRENISRLFFHKIRNKLSAITTAASYLKTLDNPSRDPDETALFGVIVDEAAQLDRELERFRIIVQYDDLSERSVIVGDELRRARDETTRGSTWSLADPSNLLHTEVAFPEGALFHLFEAIFVLHAQMSTHGTVITAPVSGRSAIQLKFTSDRSTERNVKPTQTYKYLIHLGRQMSISLNQIAHDENNNIVTIVTVPVAG